MMNSTMLQQCQGDHLQAPVESTRTSASIRRRLLKWLSSREAQPPTRSPSITPVLSNASTGLAASALSSRTSGAPTSVEANPALEISCSNSLEAVLESNSLSILSTPIPSHHFQQWLLTIKNRLEHEYSSALPNTSWGRFEFKMVRDKTGNTGPCIVFFGWDEASCTSQRGQRRAKGDLQRLLQGMESLKGCKYPVQVVICRTVLLSMPGAAKSFSEHLGNVNACFSIPANAGLEVDISLNRPLESYVGLQIRRANDIDQTCTLGGLIYAGHRIYALTVAHPFSAPKEEHERGADRDSFEYQHESSADEFGNDEDESIFKGYESVLITSASRAQSVSMLSGGGGLGGRNSEPERTEDETSDNPDHFVQNTFQSFGKIANLSHDYSLNGTAKAEYDWALIDLCNNHSPLRNVVFVSNDAHASEVIIQKHRDLDSSKVEPILVLSKFRGFVKGFTSQGTVDVILRGSRHTVHAIILEKPLMRGDSGSWVIIGAEVVGCIIAGLESIPYAYMIPMSEILKDIAVTLNTASVGILGPHLNVPRQMEHPASLLFTSSTASTSNEQSRANRRSGELPPLHPHELSSKADVSPRQAITDSFAIASPQANIPLEQDITDAVAVASSKAEETATSPETLPPLPEVPPAVSAISELNEEAEHPEKETGTPENTLRSWPASLLAAKQKLFKPTAGAGARAAALSEKPDLERQADEDRLRQERVFHTPQRRKFTVPTLALKSVTMPRLAVVLFLVAFLALGLGLGFGLHGKNPPVGDYREH